MTIDNGLNQKIGDLEEELDAQRESQARLAERLYALENTVSGLLTFLEKPPATEPDLHITDIRNDPDFPDLPDVTLSGGQIGYLDFSLTWQGKVPFRLEDGSCVVWFDLTKAPRARG